MEISYQIIVDLLANLMIVMAPIFILFEICSRIMNMFLDFVGGRRHVRLD